MNVVQKLKSIIKISDFFYSTEMLRYQEDTQYKTFTGGLVSLGIITTIIVGFANMIMNTIELNTFNISTETIKNSVPTSSSVQITEEGRFRFAIEIYQLNLSDTKRYFDVSLRLSQQEYGTVTKLTYIPLETCTKQFFKDYPDVVKNFDSLGATGWLCPPMNTTLQFRGKYSSAAYNQYIIQVSACKNTTDASRPCATPDQIKNLFYERRNFFYLDFYFTNTQINPDKKQYKQYYIEDGNYALFGSTIGTETFLYFTDYTVSTDQSIWPFEQVVQDRGCFTQGLAINHPYQTSMDDIFITFNLAKSSNSVVYKRQVQKLSAVFSFIGGMIGAVFAVLFVLKVYTSNSFEFSIAFELFQSKQQQAKNEQIDLDNSQIVKKKESAIDQNKQPFTMSFPYFIRYYAYILSQKLGCQQDSPQMKHAKACKDEILKQLDVKMLLKRIIFIEHCLTFIMDDYQIDALQLKRPRSPHEVEKIRRKCESILDCEHMESEPTHKEKQLAISNQESDKQTAKDMILKDKNYQSYKQQSFSRPEQQLHDKITVFDKKNDIIIADLQSIQEENKDPGSAKCQSRRKYARARVVDTHKRQSVRKSFLVELKKNAEAGNMISNKIWHNLDKQIRKSVEFQAFDPKAL